MPSEASWLVHRSFTGCISIHWCILTWCCFCMGLVDGAWLVLCSELQSCTLWGCLTSTDKPACSLWEISLLCESLKRHELACSCKFCLWKGPQGAVCLVFDSSVFSINIFMQIEIQICVLVGSSMCLLHPFCESKYIAVAGRWLKCRSSFIYN